MFPWHKLPLPFALLELIGFRNRMRQENLYDTETLPTQNHPEPDPSPNGQHLVSRTPEGSFNDLQQPRMGMVNTRFGRNVPLDETHVDVTSLFSPNPREVSRILLSREQFIPATTLNLLAAAWIQFETHDWFWHGRGDANRRWNIPLEPNDPWPQAHRPMEVARTELDRTRPDAEVAQPPTFINQVTHWWDASQLYGSSTDTIHKLRTHTGGKLLIQDDGLLPLNPDNGIDLAGFDDNWWIGMTLLHTLFVKEHNAICDHLKEEYPGWDDDTLFQHARKINAALMAKIHTVEWTPAILDHPALQIAMDSNWWGLLGERFKELIGRVGDSEELSGIVGSPTAHHAAPYAITEEFVAVYRMHPLMPDEFNFHTLKDGSRVKTADLHEVSGNRTRKLAESMPLADFFYSFGIAHPGAISLHNYPRLLQQLRRDNGEVFDLAAVDVLRDRERGVPRYNQFRALIGREKVQRFEDITSNPRWAEELRRVYNNNIDQVDLMVGMFAEDRPEGFGFSDTAFRIFILMASRRLKSDRFFTKDYTPEIYTQLGLDWIDNTTMGSVLKRHYPALAPALYGVENAFAPWRKLTH